MSIFLPVSQPINPSSNPGINELDPIFKLWPLASPPSNATPSTLPKKSITTVSPFFTGRFFSMDLVQNYSLAIF